ncbi:MAG: NAD-dependent epimerase/dehydratase family protein [Solirubrobacteraceae bacterium]|jgi:nucleoside-diphosphate-sugar epimerase
MTRIFITGGSGFIGGRLIGRLLAEGNSVHALARSPAAAARCRELGAEPVMGDLGDVEAMRSGAGGCEIAFHAAANAADWGKPDDFQKGNVQGTSNALEACSEAGIRRFLHIGTEAALFAGKPLVDVDETAPLRPDSRALYSASKARAEQLVLAANRDGFETVVVRPRFVWGLGDTTLLPRMVELARSGRFAWIGGGHHPTSTTHIENVLEGLVLGATRGRPGNAYFITDGDPVDFRDFVSELLATQGVQAPSRSIPVPLAAMLARGGETAWSLLQLPGRPPLTLLAYWISAQQCTIKIDKAREHLDYRPVKTIADGLAEMRSSRETST